MKNGALVKGWAVWAALVPALLASLRRRAIFYGGAGRIPGGMAGASLAAPLGYAIRCGVVCAFPRAVTVLTIAIAILLAIAAPVAAQAQGSAWIGASNKQIVQLAGQGKYAEAAAIALRARAFSERVLGKEHPGTLIRANNPAVLYKTQGRDAGEVEQLIIKPALEALKARERTLGEEHPDTLDSMNNLAFVYFAQGRSLRLSSSLSALWRSKSGCLARTIPRRLEAWAA